MMYHEVFIFSLLMFSLLLPANDITAET